MREIALDTETTGLDPDSGDRIVEIGAVELADRLATGRTLHRYVNPQRKVPEEAVKVHGLDDEFLADKPLFADVAAEFLEFIGDARLVIHNARFDMKFINAELGWAGKDPIPQERAVDTLEIAQRKFPGAQASLDALCRRFGIDNSGRSLHGALLDSQLLAEVYLELSGGRQANFELLQAGAAGSDAADWRPAPRAEPLPTRLSDAEIAAHEEFVESLVEDALWKRMG